MRHVRYDVGKVPRFESLCPSGTISNVPEQDAISVRKKFLNKNPRRRVGPRVDTRSF